MSLMEFDLAIVGGGINGACVARDAAGRNLRVLLVERGDLAGQAASGSPKIIHGGLRFLRHLELSLARAAVEERDHLLRSAPHLVHPLRFIVPQEATGRSRWAMRLESLLLNHLERDSALPDSCLTDLREHVAGAGIAPRYTRALEFSDAWTDDARLVIANCVDAARRGATILPRTECIACEREENVWRLWLKPRRGEEYEVAARAIINAAGPWVGRFLSERSPLRSRQRLQLVKGSHIVVPRLYEHSYAYAFESEDKRHVMAVPYEQDYTLIGTCESRYEGDPSVSGVTPDEIAWLCEQASRFFARPVSPAEVKWSYSGVRSVPVGDDDDTELDHKQDYVLGVDSDGPPIVSIFGGRATTCRILAQRVVDCVLPTLGRDVPAWTEEARLPGGEIPDGDLAGFAHHLCTSHPRLPEALLTRLARAYGTRVVRIIGSAQAPRPLGREIAPGLFEAELEYLVTEEWAHDVDDVLWRRSKLGMHYGPTEVAAVTAWLTRRHANTPQ